MQPGRDRAQPKPSGTPRLLGVGPAWWEVAALVQIAALGVWLIAPSLVWAGAATVLSAVTVVLAARGGMPVRVGVAVIGLAGSGAALHTSWQVQSVEERWDEVHENLVQRASERLESTLANAVASVRALADRGATLGAQDQEQAFALLEGGLAGRSPERGIVVFDESGEPWAWAGRMRLPTTPEGPGLYTRITPFYVAIESQREVAGRIAVGRVLLAADSAIPDRDGTVTARFARATGSQLEFFRPDNAPQGEDVFDYCLPACDAAEVVPDTLFSVRPVPPTQGTLKLTLLDRGGRRVAMALATALAALAVIGRPWFRWIVAATVTGLFVVTPLGPRLGLDGFFSSRTYFLTAVGWVSITAGVVFVVAAFGLIALAPVRRHAPVRPAVAVGLAAVAIGLAPYLLAWLASGVAPLASGVSWSAWIGWTLAVAAAVTAVALGAGILVRWAGSFARSAWSLWAALAAAAILAGLGLLLWQPGPGWPGWYTAAWVPAFLLAALPPRKAHLIVSTASVAGVAAALLVWGAVIDGRLLLAERDVQRLGPEADPAPIGFLERFGEELQAEALPGSSAELYLHWRASPLSRDDYPAVLITWDPAGVEVARLELARIEIPTELLRVWARAAATGHDPTLQALTKVPGIHYVLSVPHIDGSVVTVTVGPRSRAIPPVRVARFLRGDRPVSAPYEMTFSDIQRPSELPRELSWQRDGMTVRGERTFDVPGGVRHLHVQVALGEGVGGVLIRGALLAVLNITVAALFWLVGEAVRGRFKPRARWERLRGQSYRRRLTLVLGVFFLVPTLGFAAWSVGRLGAEVGHTRDVEIRQTLRDAAGTAVGALMGGGRERARLTELANRFDAELALYQDGRLAQSSAPILSELGLLEPYLAPSLFRRLVLEDELETTADRAIGGRPTRVGYRTLSTVQGSSLVLAAPRLVEETGVLADVYAVLLAAILGIAAAVWLAQRAADALAEPVQALSDAATAVGRGEAVPPFDPRMPGEFVPVVTAFERMAQDVQSHRVALEEALQFTETVLRNVATGVITLDARLRVTTANPRAVQLLGVDPVSSDPISASTGSVWTPLWEWVEDFVASNREIDAAEFTVGDMRVRAQVAALTTEEGGCVVAVDDATELAMAERVLAWGEMARQVAHEIKNPLTPIRLGIQHLQRAHRDGRGDFSSTLDRTAQQILAEIERLDAIARAFSRFGAPPVERQPMSEVDLAEVARETASLYALGGGTAVRVEAENGRRGHLRRDEFKEVLVNLIENARGAGATEIVIEVTGARDNEMGGRVQVRDNGAGIPPDNLPRIFEPHFSTTTSGTGLGLAICKRLVESWGGSITADSRVGAGTTVILDLQ